MPLLAPPPPSATFGVQFSGASPSTSPAKSTVSWPENNEETPSKDHIDSLEIQWALKTGEEAYIASLENKLAKLTSSPNPTHDSGYASSSRATLSSPAFGSFEGNGLHDADEDPEELADNAEEEDLAGRPLLASSSRLYDGRPRGSSGREIPTSPPPSTVARMVVVPPTPQHEDNDSEPDEVGHGVRRPANGRGEAVTKTTPTKTENRRISFSNSVRISGGIKKQSRRSHVLPADLFSPIPPAAIPNPIAPATERTRLFGTTPPGSAAFPAFPRVRSASPASIASHARSGSVTSLYPQHSQHYSGYSSTATSAVPSRSSSPCSSIYAPLQPPSQTCPTPMLTRPPVKRPPRQFTFFYSLFGVEVDEEATQRPYKSLINAQVRSKKSRGSQKGLLPTASGVPEREQEERSVWGWIVELLSSGVPVSGGRGGGGVPVMNLPPDAPSRPRAGRRMSFSSDEDGDAAQRPQGGSGRGRSRKIRKTLSTLSLSSTSDDVHAYADDEHEAESSIHLRSPETSSSKTETDVRFGAVPKRWVNWEWWIWKMERAAAPAVSTVRSCFGWEREDVDDGYQQV